MTQTNDYSSMVGGSLPPASTSDEGGSKAPKLSSTHFRDNMPEMNAKTLKEAAMANEGYETPELNDKLYLHFKGWRRIENLEPYTGLVALWLDSNGKLGGGNCS